MSIRERLASIQHEIWAHWMKYQFSQCYSDEVKHPGCLIIPTDKVERWKRQMNTPYAELTHKEQESDRHQADKVINAISERLNSK